MLISYLQAEGNDAALVLNDTVAVKNFGLFLDPAVDETTYLFEIVPYTIDTLSFDPVETETNILPAESHFITFSYNRRQRIISPDCGVEQSFYNLTIVDHDFDSAAIVNDTLDRYIPVNVKIYF